MELTSRERLLKTFKGEEVDRVPISLYEFEGSYSNWIHNCPEYVEILDYAKGKTDPMCFWGPSGDNVLFYGEVEPGTIENSNWKDERSNFRERTIHTPRGELTTVGREDEGIHTRWTIEHLCKTVDDAEKVLSLPYVTWRPAVDSFFELDKELGDRGIILGDVPDALCCTVELFGFSEFLMLFVDNRELVFKLLDFFQERICNYMEHLLKSGATTVYRIVGPEYATPPYMSPKEFDNLVTRYDKELVKLLHRYGGIARLHSHGKIGQVLDAFLEMEVDATDPVEPPPDGDVELKEAMERLPGVTLIGNIEERLFEIGTRQDVESAVRKAMEQTVGGQFILCPTAMPLTTPLDKRIQENIIHYIDCGLKYGKR